ncbi:MAG: hypothetical protein ACRECI_11670 [Methyloceanibacter sp.]|jgi:hypothetical protein
MRPIFLAICLLALSTEAGLARQSAGEQWEQALLSAKRHGTLAGPRPGQACLWSKPLGACLWYTPSKWNLMLTDH